jgi:Ca2+-binding EF-hand superfamily protein
MTIKKTLTLALVTGLAFGSTAALAEGMRDGRGGHGERFFSKLDTNADGKVTKEELSADVTSRFAAVDVNKDGKVTQDEATQYFTAKRAEMKQKFAERLKEADANKDGKWSKDELTKMPEGKFGKLDVDSDGFVTEAELTAHHEARRAKFEEKHGDKADMKSKLWQHADVNGDGVVDRAEALKVAETRFSKLDSNGDGAVERSELKSGHHRHGKKHACHGDKQGKPSTTAS